MSCTINNVRFTSSDGVSRVHGWVYAPSCEPVALLQISHGMCEYIGRYHWFMEALCERGFVVFGNDHIGHGESSDEENYGFLGEKNGYRHLINDLHRMSVIVKEHYPDLPLFVFGHSMGSFAARLYMAKYGDEINGAVLCGTSGPNPMAKAGASLAAAIAKVKGAKHRSNTLLKIAFGSYNSRYENPETTHDWLTRDKKVIECYLQDPKCTFCFTAAGFKDLFTMVDKCNRKSWYRSLRKNLPILLISGDMDPVGDYGKGVASVQEKLLENGMQDVSMIIYPEARHELTNEINCNEVLEDVAFWLQQLLPIPF